MLKKLQAIWKRATGQGRDQPRLDIGEGEVALFDHGEEIWRFRWADISRVETYKRDLFVVDMIGGSRSPFRLLRRTTVYCMPETARAVLA
ncbi:MAG TPA: hypothetical protein VF278_16035 [Pirellulales bacterium]